MRSRSRSRVAGSVRVSTGNALVRIVENRDAPKEEDIGRSNGAVDKSHGCTLSASTLQANCFCGGRVRAAIDQRPGPIVTTNPAAKALRLRHRTTAGLFGFKLVKVHTAQQGCGTTAAGHFTGATQSCPAQLNSVDWWR